MFPTALPGGRDMNALFLGLSLVAGAPALKDPPAKPPSVEGEWTVVSSVAGGQSDGVMEKNPIDKIVITADKWIVVRGGRPSTGSDITLDPKQDPPHLDLGWSGKTGTRGIYKLEGDSLIVCYTLNGERPTKIESPPNSNVRMMTLKRLKK
jgi:uncharacterized protein (TIGR03067 family)